MKISSVLVATVLALAASTLSFAAEAAVHEKAATPLHVSHGQEISLEDYLVPGKTTVFDFTSQFCPPCRAIAPKLDQLHQSRDDVAVVKVDINRPDVKGIDWKSPVAQQHALKSVPYFKVYGPDGKLVAEGKEASALVSSWFK